MKQQHIKKLFTLVGFLILAFVAVNMNACSKDKGNNHGYPGFGIPGFGVPGQGGHLGNGVAVSGDGVLTMQLTFAGQNGGQVGAMGTLWVNGQSAGCSVPPGQYVLQTIQPGYFQNGDFYQIRLQAVGGYYPLDVYIERAWFTNQYLQDGSRKMFVNANITGCPTIFN